MIIRPEFVLFSAQFVTVTINVVNQSKLLSVLGAKFRENNMKSINRAEGLNEYLAYVALRSATADKSISLSSFRARQINLSEHFKRLSEFPARREIIREIIWRRYSYW
jgi:hypothetical protein